MQANWHMTKTDTEQMVNQPLFQAHLIKARHLFWDVDPLTLDPDRHSSFIIERILHFGLPEDVRRMLQQYDDATIRSVVSHSRHIDRKTATFWALHLNIPREEITCFSTPLINSCFYFHHPLLKPLQTFQNLNVASLEDIAAMKAVAISQRGDKKDFFDMYEILKTIPHHALKRLFLEKFSEARINCHHILKSFFYFDDADQQPDPISLNGTTWEQVKSYFADHEKILMKELIC